MKLPPGIMVFWLIATTTVHSQVPISFCDLLGNSEKYDGKEVTVRATYRYGFEWQELYCLDCLVKDKVWLEFGSDLDDSSHKALRRAPKGAGIVNLTVQGTFKSGGSFGRLAGYRYELTARNIRDVVVVQKGMKNRAEEEKAEKRWGCGGASPK
jgi:hypothetical protein